jgi:NAD(P)-dependent dehydrogenase (short-subunit alcohol dehydrogenase family)
MAELDRQYATNVRGPYHLTKLFLPALKAAKGQVIFINSSIVRAANIATYAQYAATKHALKAVADSLRDEVNGEGVSVTTIFPGSTATPTEVELHRATSKL